MLRVNKTNGKLLHGSLKDSYFVKLITFFSHCELLGSDAAKQDLFVERYFFKIA